MNEITSKNTIKINDKFCWAIRSSEKIKLNKTDKNELQDNFWSFLTAFQQIWYYFSGFIQELNPHISKNKISRLSQAIIEEWKCEMLNEAEKKSWDILHKLRNYDTHSAPVTSNYILKNKLLISNGKKILTTNTGKYLTFSSGNITVLFEGKEYDIDKLTSNGLTAINKLIDYMPLIEEKIIDKDYNKVI